MIWILGCSKVVFQAEPECWRLGLQVSTWSIGVQAGFSPGATQQPDRSRSSEGKTYTQRVSHQF